MSRKALLCGGFFALIGVVCTACSSFADDGESAQEKRVQVIVRAQAVGEASGYWIGVHAEPIGDALKSHLGLEEDRLIVKHVVPDSPAAKAGLKQHDVLLKFGGTELSKLSDLIDAVGKNKDKEAKVTIVRGGEQQKVEIEPAKRPEGDFAIRLPEGADEDVRVLLGEWLGDKGKNVWHGQPMKFGFVGPGFVGEGPHVQMFSGKLPKNLSISITKKGDEPANITVKQGDKTWELTEDSLDELPEEIRVHVKGMTGKAGAQAFSFGFVPEGQGAIRLKQFTPKIEIQQEDEDDESDDVGRKIQRRIRLNLNQARNAEEILKAIQPGGSSEIEKLRKEVEALRQELKKLTDDDEDDDDEDDDDDDEDDKEDNAELEA